MKFKAPIEDAPTEAKGSRAGARKRRENARTVEKAVPVLESPNSTESASTQIIGSGSVTDAIATSVRLGNHIRGNAFMGAIVRVKNETKILRNAKIPRVADVPTTSADSLGPLQANHHTTKKKAGPRGPMLAISKAAAGSIETDNAEASPSNVETNSTPSPAANRNTSKKRGESRAAAKVGALDNAETSTSTADSKPSSLAVDPTKSATSSPSINQDILGDRLDSCGAAMVTSMVASFVAETSSIGSASPKINRSTPRKRLEPRACTSTGSKVAAAANGSANSTDDATSSQLLKMATVATPTAPPTRNRNAARRRLEPQGDTTLASKGANENIASDRAETYNSIVGHTSLMGQTASSPTPATTETTSPAPSTKARKRLMPLRGAAVASSTPEITNNTAKPDISSLVVGTTPSPMRAGGISPAAKQTTLTTPGKRRVNREAALPTSKEPSVSDSVLDVVEVSSTLSVEATSSTLEVVPTASSTLSAAAEINRKTPRKRLEPRVDFSSDKSLRSMEVITSVSPLPVAPPTSSDASSPQAINRNTPKKRVQPRSAAMATSKVAITNHASEKAQKLSPKVIPTSEKTAPRTTSEPPPPTNNQNSTGKTLEPLDATLTISKVSVCEFEKADTSFLGFEPMVFRLEPVSVESVTALAPSPTSLVAPSDIFDSSRAAIIAPSKGIVSETLDDASLNIKTVRKNAPSPRKTHLPLPGKKLKTRNAVEQNLILPIRNRAAAKVQKPFPDLDLVNSPLLVENASTTTASETLAPTVNGRSTGKNDKSNTTSVVVSTPLSAVKAAPTEPPPVAPPSNPNTPRKKLKNQMEALAPANPATNNNNNNNSSESDESTSPHVETIPSPQATVPPASANVLSLPTIQSTPQNHSDDARDVVTIAKPSSDGDNVADTIEEPPLEAPPRSKAPEPQIMPIADLNANYGAAVVADDAPADEALPVVVDTNAQAAEVAAIASSDVVLPESPRNQPAAKADHLKSPAEQVSSDSQLVKSPTAMLLIETQPVNSPSTMSLDSAKGSSVMNDAAWMMYCTGDLFWGQIYSYCYWPCMVSPDPDNKTIDTQDRTAAAGQTQQDEAGTAILVHVRFFANNGQRNWVKRENLIAFNGLEPYQELIHDVREKYGLKSLKFKRMTPQSTQRARWQRAIAEADILAELPHAERLEKFLEFCEEARALQSFKRKRMQSAMWTTGSTSDIGSMYNSSENVSGKPSPTVEAFNSSSSTNNNNSTANYSSAPATKRLRSVSPLSPAFSPIKSRTPPQSAAESTTPGQGQKSFTAAELQKVKFNENDKDYRRLCILLREFVMSSDSVEFEHKFNMSVRDLWAFRELNVEATLQSGGDTLALLDDSSNEMAIKRLTPRLRGLTRAVGPPSTVPEHTPEKEFRRFYLIIKDFVLGIRNSASYERVLVVIVRNIWALRTISQRQAKLRLLVSFDKDCLGSLEEVSGNGGGGESGTKRYSNRLRGLIATRNLFQSSSTPLNDSNDSQSGGPLNSTAGAEPPASVSMEAAAAAANKVPKVRKPLSQPLDEVIDSIFELDNKYLFRTLGREPICMYCQKSEGAPLLNCDGGCLGAFHAACAGKQEARLARKNVRQRRLTPPPPPATSDASTLAATAVEVAVTAPARCVACAQKLPSSCEVCGSTDEIDSLAPVACNMSGCHKFFHPPCCRYWPQARITKSQQAIEAFRCPSHVCHTCVSDDPKRKSQHLGNARLVKCTKCPATYHADSDCIPAGSEILTTAHIVCPRHAAPDYGGGEGSAASRLSAPVNVNWCFICVGGGHLVCCDTCPTAVHAQCLNIDIDPHEAYICEECESGRLPLYGEVVWAKFNSCRWWPGIILPPPEVPTNISGKAHAPGEFVVRFFGTHDHGWLPRRRVYLYQEGDSSMLPRKLSGMDMKYAQASEEAKVTYEMIKQRKMREGLSENDRRGEKLQPQPYVRIKANRAVPPLKLHIDMEKVNACDCRADSEDPCGPDSDCINRVLYHECSAKLCPAGNLCQNQMFQRGISPRLSVTYMRERGFGLVTREAITSGSFVIEYVGEIINDDEFRLRIRQKTIDREENFYFLAVEKDHTIDAGAKGNLARFMNHSCEPNCEAQKWSVNGLQRVGLFAIKDIPPNTELTFNYHWNELLDSGKKICFCGASRCAGQIGSKYREEAPPIKDMTVPLKGQKATHKKGKLGKSLKRLQHTPLPAGKATALAKSSKGTNAATKSRAKVSIIISATHKSKMSEVGSKKPKIVAGKRNQLN